VPQRVAVSTEEGTEILGASGDTPLAVGAGLREGRPELVELLAGGAPGVLGVLCLQKGGGAAAFSDEERMLASALSGHLAISCWNSMLLEEIRHQAAFDDLTGLAGRRHFMDELHRELDRARREERPLSVLMLDADHFKQLNDRHGHAAGDSVLAALAERLRRGTRSIDVVGRLGGEEMGVLLPGAGPTVAVMVAERIRRSVAAMHVPWVGDEALRLTVSVGAATWDRVLGAEQLLALADRALYAAKERGRDQVVSLEQLETMETLDLPIVR
jgi:diguanylate cyclase (GGDEF)-like protein